jgi:signal transduction histidine kinase
VRNTCQGVGSTIQVRAQLSGIRRCLENLIDNAIRYGGEAAVEIENDSETVRIIVTDNGPGIPEGSLKMVLQPFYRLESSRNRSTGGVGLGLAITHDIVRRHAGSLVLINVPSGGLRAVLSLPISQITGTY